MTEKELQLQQKWLKKNKPTVIPTVKTKYEPYHGKLEQIPKCGSHNRGATVWKVSDETTRFYG